MSAENKDWIEAVTKLLKMTQAGELRWDAVSSPAEMNSEETRVEVVLWARYNDKKLRIYTKQTLGPEYFEFNVGDFSPRPVRDWQNETVLEFISNDGAPLWRVPKISALGDLYQAARYQASGAGEFLKEILGR